MADLFVEHCRDRNDVTDKAIARFVDVVADVQISGGLHGDKIARVVLTGGGAGLEFCSKLARLAEEKDSGVDFSKIYFYFGDERAVPLTDPDSNEGQIKEIFFDPAGIDPTHIFGWDLGRLSVEESQAYYIRVLEKTAPLGFDIHLLGMGGEGHINSLFPYSEATLEPSQLTALELDSPKPPSQRTTLTLPAVKRSRHVWLIVSGDDKKEAVDKLVAGCDFKRLPAAGAIGTQSTILFTDQV